MSYQIFKFLHILGLALTFGGTLATLLLVLLFKAHPQNTKACQVTSHFIAGTGMVIAIASGVIYSALTDWAFFRVGYFMHLKMMLVLAAGIFLSVDIRAQGVLRRARLKKENTQSLEKPCVNKQVWAGIFGLLCLIVIFILIIFKPFSS